MPFSFYDQCLQPLDHLIHGWANHGILQRQLRYLNHFLSVGVRILATCLWTVFVNVAIIVVSQERARRRFKNEIAILVDSQVFFLEIPWPHPECLRKSFNVILIEDGAGGLATVGALEAISFSEDFIVQTMESIIDFTGIHFFEAGKKFPILRFLIPGLRFKLFCVHVIYRHPCKYRKENGTPRRDRSKSGCTD